jgi:hypothetical protein
MSTTSPVKMVTPNYNFVIPRFDSPGWGKAVSDALIVIDGLMFAATGIAQLRGAWLNATVYSEGDRVIDQIDGRLYQALVDHTSAATGTFEDERTANPSYWFSPSTDIIVRGEFTPTTLYNVGDFVTSSADLLGGVVNTEFTSTASLRDDIDKLSIIYDLLYLKPANAAELREGAAGRVLNTDAIWDAAEAADLGNFTGSRTVDADAVLGYAKGTVTGNTVITSVINPKPGKTFVLDLVNNETGGYTFEFGSPGFVTSEGLLPDYVDTANARNIYTIMCLHDGSALVNCIAKGVA